MITTYFDSEGISGGKSVRAAVRYHSEGVRAQVLLLRHSADQAVFSVHG